MCSDCIDYFRSVGDDIACLPWERLENRLTITVAGEGGAPV